MPENAPHTTNRTAIRNRAARARKDDAQLTLWDAIDNAE